MARSLTGSTQSGTHTVARIPRRPATSATALPWFPDEAATTPLPRCPASSLSSRLAAPRTLKDPVCWSDSSLMWVGGAPGRSSGTTGVSPSQRTDAAECCRDVHDYDMIRCASISFTTHSPEFRSEVKMWPLWIWAPQVIPQLGTVVSLNRWS